MGSTLEGTASYVVDPRTGAGLPHYLAAMTLVGLLLGGAAVTLGRAPPSDAMTETQDAVLVDLPPVEAGAHPQGDDAPTQQAAPAAAGAEMPQPQPTPKPPDETAPPKPVTPETHEAVPQAPAPAAVLDTPATPPPQAAAPASAPQEAHEAGGPQAARAQESEADDAETRRASTHLVTLWQKALMARLQAARRGLGHALHDAGVVKVAFEIDRGGRLVSERVAQGSGSPALDAAALGLVRRAAPYPTPPRDAAAAQLSFVVPISFRR